MRTLYLHWKGLLGGKRVGYGEFLGQTHAGFPRHCSWPQPRASACPSSIPAPAPTASGTTPCRARSGAGLGTHCRDPLASLPAEGGKITQHKKSSLFQSSPTHSPCSKSCIKKKREEPRTFMATIWAALSLLEEEHGKPRQGNSFLSEGATELPGSWLLQGVQENAAGAFLHLTCRF